MATSGTYTSVANFNIAQIIDEAFRRLKITPEQITAEHTLSARISLDLMFIDWINDGVQQFIIDQEEYALDGDSSDISFTTPTGTIDVLDMVYRNTTDDDIQIGAISRKDYLDIVQKDVSGQPITYFVDKTTMPPVVYLWPVNNISGTSIVYNRLRQIQDVGAPTNTPDITVTYKEAMCACLTAKLAEKYADKETEDRMLAKADKAYRLAIEQDRDRAPLIIKPRIGRRFYYGTI